MRLAWMCLIILALPMPSQAESCRNGTGGTLRLEYYEVKANDVDFGLDEGYGATNLTMALRSPNSALAVVASYQIPCTAAPARIIDAVQTAYVTEAPAPVAQDFVLLAVTSVERARAALEQCQRALIEAKRTGKNLLVLKSADRLVHEYCEVGR